MRGGGAGPSVDLQHDLALVDLDPPKYQPHQFLALRRPERRVDRPDIRQRLPRRLRLDDVALGADPAAEDACHSSAIAAGLIDGLHAGLLMRWQELRAVELVLDEAAAAFDGEGVLHAEVQRALFDAAKQRVVDLHGAMQAYRQFTLDEPGEEAIAGVRRLMAEARP